MRKLVSFFHVSLDGFVGGLKGELDWAKVDAELFNYIGQRINGTDTALYGRVTWQMMESYWPTAAEQPNASKHDIEHAAWYNKAHKIVLSKTMKDEQAPNTSFIGEDVATRIKELKAQKGSEILVFGSPSATHVLLQDELIDEFWLFVNPVLLGEGIALFKNIPGKTELKLLNTKIFDNGVVCMQYGRV
jgi:dihydrofolate reductase